MNTPKNAEYTEDKEWISAIRRDFPILAQTVNGHPLCYLDNAATTQKPRQVVEAISNYYYSDNANIHRSAHTLANRATQCFEDVRHKVAKCLNAKESCEIVWNRGTTEAINLVAFCFVKPRLKEGDRILLQQDAHHANIVPWQRVAQETGAIIDVIPVREGVVDLAAYRQLLTRQPAFIALSHVSNVLGTIHPIAEMCRMAASTDIPVMVDGAQASPHLAIDVQTLGCDFYAFSGHKMFGPTGIGVLWGKKEWLEKMPPWQSGGEMIEHVSFNKTRFAGLPYRFEAGTPDIAGVIGLGAALDYLDSLDQSRIHTQEHNVLAHALECCSAVPGFELMPQGPDTVSLFSFQLANHHQQDVALWLDRQGIAVRAGHHCAMPLIESMGLPGTLRASFTFYNTLDEAENLARHLDEISRENTTQVPIANTQVRVNPELFTAVENARNPQLRYRALMKLGSALPVDESLRQPRFVVAACETATWLALETDNEGRLAIRADSEARILRAILALIIEKANGLTAKELQSMDLRATLTRLDLSRHLSPTRGNGINVMIDAVEHYIDELLSAHND